MYSLKAIKFKTFVGLCRDMSSRKHVSNDEYLSPKMRLCLFYGSACNAEEALALQESDITPDFLMANGVKARNMSAAGVGPRFLKDMGVSDCAQLRTMGFDALDLADTKFASEACLAYGADQILDVFLTGASDAVAIAGSDTTHITGVSTSALLSVCAGAPVEARAVLQQLPSGVSLEGVDADTLLDTGIRKSVLSQLGYSLTSIVSQTKANAQQLAKLGYSVG
jgi:hypothetical protein